MAGTVGIDVGGTYTDLYFSGGDGIERVIKVPSTPKDPSIGLLDALRAAEIKPDDLDQILHGTTIATNAVIERRGARCALITTRGFRDVLELGPPRPPEHVWADRHPAPAHSARLPLGGRRAARLSGQCSDAAACQAGARSRAGASGRERRCGRGVAPALLRQSGARGRDPRHPAGGESRLGGRDLQRRDPRILRVRAHQHRGGAGLSAAAGLALCEEPAGEARRLGLRPPDADHAVERRRRAGEPARQPRGVHRAFRSGGRRDGGGRACGRSRLRPHHHRRHGRHQLRRRGGDRGQARDRREHAARLPHSAAPADDRRAHDRRRRRQHRAYRSRRHPAGRAGKRRRLSGPGVLGPRRHAADRDRRQCRAGAHRSVAPDRDRAREPRYRKRARRDGRARRASWA